MYRQPSYSLSWARVERIRNKDIIHIFKSTRLKVLCSLELRIDSQFSIQSLTGYQSFDRLIRDGRNIFQENFGDNAVFCPSLELHGPSFSHALSWTDLTILKKHDRLLITALFQQLRSVSARGHWHQSYYKILELFKLFYSKFWFFIYLYFFCVMWQQCPFNCCCGRNFL